MPEPFDAYYKWLGISPKDQPPNHYRLLAIDLFETDPDVIASAADRQMAHMRSYQTGKNSALSQKILNEISAARICLLNAAKKEEYDERLRQQLQSAQEALEPAPAETLARPAESAPPRRSRRPSWQTIATIVAAVVVCLGALAVLFNGRGEKEPALSEKEQPPAPHRDVERHRGHRPEAEQPPAPRRRGEERPPPGRERDTPNPRGERPLRDAVDAESRTPPGRRPRGEQPPADQSPPERPRGGREPVPEPEKPSKEPEAKPSEEKPPQEKPPAPTETIEQAAARLKAGLAGAKTPDDLKGIAADALTVLDRAIADSNEDVAKKLAAMALTAARKSDDFELTKQATLRFAELQSPLSDAMKEKARQRLNRAEPPPPSTTRGPKYKE